MWLYLPSTSVPATEDSNSPSDPWHGYEPWLTLSGTPTRRPSSWSGWRKRGWITLLSGMTSSPSTASRGVAEWISSLPGSPASRSARPVASVGLTMTAGSGRPSHPSSLTWDPSSSCWRTSPSLFDSGSRMSSTTLPTSGSMRNGVCSARQPLEHLTDASASGSWPTPNAADGARKSETMVRGNLTPLGAARQWPTPLAGDAKKNTASQDALDRGFMGTMTDMIRMWPTQRAAASDTSSSDPGLRAVTITTDGPGGSPKADLNPFFIATLMGLSMDWLTLSTLGVTALCRRQLHTPSDSCSTAADGS